MVTGELKNLIPLPPETAYLWEWYRDIEAGRQYGMSGPLPLQWGEIEAYFRLQRVRLDTWEVATIRNLDAEYIASLVDEGTPAVANASSFRDVVNEPTANRSRRS